MKNVMIRAFDKNTLTMYPPMNFYDFNHKCVVQDNLDIMFSIGSNDKNGNMLFDLDIVLLNKKPVLIKYYPNYGMYGFEGVNRYGGGIDYLKPMGSTGSSTNYKPYVINEFYQKRIELIGNFHQNMGLIL